MNTETFEIKFKKLPEYLKKEVIDFIEFLAKKHPVPTGSKDFIFNWEGSLAKLRKDYSSVELQHNGDKHVSG